MVSSIKINHITYPGKIDETIYNFHSFYSLQRQAIRRKDQVVQRTKEVY